MVQSKLNLRARRTLELVLTRNGHLVKSELILTPRDVHAGPGAAFEIVHPDVPSKFRLFETRDGDYATLWVCASMHGRLYTQRDTYSLKSLIQAANVKLAKTSLIPLDLQNIHGGRLKLDAYDLNFELYATPASGSMADSAPQLDLPYRRTDPPALQPGSQPPPQATPPRYGAGALQVTLMQRNIVLREKVYPERQPILIGPAQYLCVNRNHIPIQFTLLEVERGDYYLRFLAAWQGRVFLGGRAGVATLAELVGQRAGHVALDIYRLRFTPGMKCTLKIGDAVLLISFVEASA